MDFTRASLPSRAKSGLDWAGFLTVFLLCGLTFQAEAEPEIDEASLHRAYLPDARDGSRQLDLAIQLLKERRFSEAIPQLLELARSDEDRAYGVRSDQRHEFLSLKQRARSALDGLGPAGWRAYELTTASAAERELRSALSVGGDSSFADVARRYPNTGPSAVACWQLARLSSARGEHERALAWINALKANERFAQEYDPQATLLAATCHLALGNPAKAEQQIERIVSTGERDRLLSLIAAVNVESDDQSYVRRGSNLARRVTEALAEATQTNPVPQTNNAWLGVGGDRRRALQLSGGEPHPWPGWTARTASSVDEQNRWVAYATRRRREGAAAIAAASPVGLDDQLICRTAERIIAIDWQTGRRLWQTRSESNRRANGIDASDLFGQREPSSSVVAELLAEEWLDRVGSSLSSNGTLVFAVHNQLASNNQQGLRAFGRKRPFGWANARGASAGPPPSNRLSAYDPRLEGKLVWEANGLDSDSEWAGAFFLDAPLAIDGRLLAIHEREQTLFLNEIDPASGKKWWSQPLVSLEDEYGGGLARRLVGVGMSAIGEVVVCSTGAGVVVAVDLPSRTLKWVARLPIDAKDLPRPGSLWARQRNQRSLLSRRLGWLENRVSISFGRVIIASPESDQLHALDAKTGERLWTSDRDGALLITSVAPDRIALQSAHQVRVLDASTGETEWQTSTADHKSIVGRGLRVDDTLLIPCEQQKLLAIDLNEQTQREVTTQDAPLGNLIGHGGAIVAQGLGAINRFDLLARNEINATARSTNDHASNRGNTSLTEGERLLSQGDWRRALEAFDQLDPVQQRRPVVKNRRWRAGLVALRNGEATEDGLERLLNLTPTQRDRLTVLSIASRLAADRNDDTRVIDYAAQAASQPQIAEAPTAINPDHLVLPTRRIAGAVADAWASLPESERDAWDRAVTQTINGIDNPVALARGVTIYHALPSSAAGRQRIADLWRSRGDQSKGAYYSALAGPPAVDTTPRRVQTGWSLRQAETLTETRGSVRERVRNAARRSSVAGFLTLPVEQLGANGIDFESYALSADGHALVSWDQAGSRRFRVAVPTVGGDISRRLKMPSQRRVETPPLAWCVAGQLVLTGATSGDVVGVNTGAAARGEEPVAWRAQTSMQSFYDSAQDGEPAASSQAEGRRTVAPAAARVGNRRGAAGYRWSALGVSEGGVLIRDRRAVACLDPFTGRTQWAREDLRLNQATVVVGRRYAFASRRDGSTVRIRLLDGQVDAGWTGPPGKWITVRNNHLVATQRTGQATRVTVTATDSGKTVFEKRFRNAKLLRIHHSHEFLIASESGTGVELIVLDPDTGSATLSARVPAATVGEAIAAWRRPFGLLVSLDRSSNARLPSIGSLKIESGPLLNGPLICLATDGAISWRAELSGYEMIRRTPVACPLVVLGKREQNHSPVGVKFSTRLLVLDGVSGRSVADVQRVPEDIFAGYQLRYRGGASPSLEASFRRTATRVRLTEAPLPPGPPYTAAVESPTKITSKELIQLGQQAIEAVKKRQRSEQD